MKNDVWYRGSPKPLISVSRYTTQKYTFQLVAISTIKYQPQITVLMTLFTELLRENKKQTHAKTHTQGPPQFM